MDTKEYSLLEKEICARLPYNLKVQYKLPNYQTNEFDTEEGIAFCVNLGMGLVDIHGGGIDYNISIHKVKPILRPISSMTKEECDTLFEILNINEDAGDWLKINDINAIRLFTQNGKDFYEIAQALNYLHSIQIDYNGLIEDGLAVELKNKDE